MVPMAYRLAHERNVPGAGVEREENGEDEDEEKEERRVVLKISADDEEEQREGAFRRLETLGYRVGLGFAER